MALKDDRRGRSGLRYAVRLAGVAALLVAGVGAVLAAPILAPRLARAGNLFAARQFSAGLAEAGGAAGAALGAADTLDRVGGWLVLVGLLVALAALVAEVVAVTRRVAGARSAAGINFVAQVSLAAVLLVLVNVYACLHPAWYDWSRGKQFTLPADVATRLRELKEPTTVVVYRRGASGLSGRPDPTDTAAEQKVTEKVLDLVGQFRRFGPAFEVEVVDAADPKSPGQLAALDAKVPGLKAAVEAAPEDSVFFAAEGKPAVQRLAFREFFALDKAASQTADGGKGNLVLLSQGVEPFADRVFALEGRKPRVGLLAIHEVLTSRSERAEYTLAGLRKSLEAQGFEVGDVVLKNWQRGRDPEPTASTFEDSRLERLDAELAALDLAIRRYRAQEAAFRKTLAILRSPDDIDEVNRKLRDQLPGGRKLTEIDRALNATILEERLRELEDLLEERRRVESERQPLAGREDIVEARRVTDLKEKLGRRVADFDLLVVPRMTLMNLAAGDFIPGSVYGINAEQTAAVKDFLKAGKPVLACFGPTNEPEGPDPAPDELERLLAELGIRFGSETVLFDAERRALAGRRAADRFGGLEAVELPPVRFADPRPGAAGDNPLASGLAVEARAAGDRFDLKLRHPRPVDLRPASGAAVGFLFTDPKGWREEKPFPTESYTPSPDAPKAGLVGPGGSDDRKGPVCVGVAAEVTLPPSFYDDRIRTARALRVLLDAPASAGALPAGLATAVSLPDTGLYTTGKPASEGEANTVPPESERPKVRLAAIGHGGLFVGTELKPAQERVLVDTCNWLLHRDDRLPRAAHEWRYPRVPLDEDARRRWAAGTLIGLPALFAALGVAVYLTRSRR